MSDTEQFAPEPSGGSASITPSRSALDLRQFTTARIALDSTGVSVTTRHALEFSLAHAQARDAVHSSLAVPSLLAALRDRGLVAVSVRSATASRTEYLRRPDLGRTLASASAALLQLATHNPHPAAFLTIILADGLSALAVERHALSLLDALLPLLGLGPAEARAPTTAWAKAPSSSPKRSPASLSAMRSPPPLPPMSR